MIVLLIIGSAFIGILILVYIGLVIRSKSRKKRMKGWQIGDLINTYEHEMLSRGLKFQGGYLQAKLLGWTEEHLYLDFGGDNVHRCSWDVMECNKSDLWRQNYKDCEEAMGMKPGFGAKVTPSMDCGKKIDWIGKPIELLSEVECEVFLKQAIDKEDYEAAEQIRKRMEKFR